MGQLKKVELNPVTISIEPKTRLLLIKQGDNEVKLTRDAVIGMKKLHDGENPNGVYTSPLIPRNRFTVAPDGAISIVCQDDWESNVVLLKRHHKKCDDYQRVLNFVDSHKAGIAWAKEFKGMR